MNETTNRVCVIPIRSGSKGIPDKNIRSFHGRPLIAYSIEQALDSQAFDVVAVSSDSEKYLNIAQEAGADFLIQRPDVLASDTAETHDVLLHALSTVEQEYERKFHSLCLLQATSPLRRAIDITEACDMLDTNKWDNIVSVTKASESPYITLIEPCADTGGYEISKPLDRTISRRQESPPVYQINGSIYVWRREALLNKTTTVCTKTNIYEMSELRSIDIDTEVDWAFAELAFKMLNENPCL